MIRNLHPQLKRKIKSSFQTILSDPFSGKALKDDLTGLRSFRVSRYRIIYKVSDRKQIEVVAVGPRKRIYEDTFHILKKENK